MIMKLKKRPGPNKGLYSHRRRRRRRRRRKDARRTD
jgi:hypothetical protein